MVEPSPSVFSRLAPVLERDSQPKAMVAPTEFQPVFQP
jgi:hypothetical protein